MKVPRQPYNYCVFLFKQIIWHKAVELHDINYKNNRASNFSISVNIKYLFGTSSFKKSQAIKIRVQNC